MAKVVCTHHETGVGKRECRPCAAERMRLHHLANPSARFWAQMWRLYRLRPDDWHRMLISQDGRCGACNDPLRVPCVDHNHATGAVRGMLCNACNKIAGFAQDCPDRVVSVALYLEATCQTK